MTMFIIVQVDASDEYAKAVARAPARKLMASTFQNTMPSNGNLVWTTRMRYLIRLFSAVIASQLRAGNENGKCILVQHQFNTPV